MFERISDCCMFLGIWNAAICCFDLPTNRMLYGSELSMHPWSVMKGAVDGKGSEVRRSETSLEASPSVIDTIDIDVIFLQTNGMKGAVVI